MVLWVVMMCSDVSGYMITTQHHNPDNHDLNQVLDR